MPNLVVPGSSVSELWGYKFQTFPLKRTWPLTTCQALLYRACDNTLCHQEHSYMHKPHCKLLPKDHYLVIQKLHAANNPNKKTENQSAFICSISHKTPTQNELRRQKPRASTLQGLRHRLHQPCSQSMSHADDRRCDWSSYIYHMQKG
jgi:hypothetical protein